MKNGHRPSVTKPHAYLIPSAAYEALAEIRDHLRMLAQLTEPQAEAGPDVIYLSARALARCFDRFADDLDQVAEVIEPTGP
ncbi:XAC0095 family protein [Lysobacter enzymogenes]|uniref:XAC0095 family protein n=1 Tax=Lysobacter enzymogenes TaxID=69 RepID=UPI003D18BCEB